MHIPYYIYRLQEVTLGLLLAGIGYHRENFRNYLMVEHGSYCQF